MFNKLIRILCFVCLALVLTGCFKLDPYKEFDKMNKVVTGSGSFKEAQRAYGNFIDKMVEESLSLADKDFSRGLSEDEAALYSDIRSVITRATGQYGYLISKAKKLDSIEDKKEAALWIEEKTSWPGPDLQVILDGRSIHDFSYDGDDTTIDISRIISVLGDMGLEFAGFADGSEFGLSAFPISDPFGEEVEISAVMPVNLHYQGYGGKDTEIVRVTYGDDVMLPDIGEDDRKVFCGWATEKGDYIVGDYYLSYVKVNPDSYVKGNAVSTRSLESPDLYLIYSELQAEKPLIFDGEYSNSGVANPGEIIKMIPVVGNVGKTRESFEIALGKLDEASSSYAVVRQKGTFASYRQESGYGDFPLYPGKKMAISSNTDSVLMDSNINMSERYSDAYIEIVIDPDTPSGTVLHIPMTITTDDGKDFDVVYDVIVEESDFNPVLRQYEFSDKAGNGDGKINPGETIYLDIVLEGRGKIDTGRSLRSILSTESEYVEFTSSLIEDEYLRPGEYANGTYCNYKSLEKAVKGLNPVRGSNMFSFTIDKDCPGGTAIPFMITTTDKTGKEKVNIFELLVTETDARIIFNKYGIREKSGDGDRKVNPGETFSLDTSFRNVGSSTLENLYISIWTEQDGVSLSTKGDIWEIGDDGKQASNTWKEIKSNYYINSRYYNDRSSDTYESIDDAILVTLSPDYDVKKPITFNWKATGDGNTSGWKGSFSIPVRKTSGNISLSGYAFVDNGNGNSMINIGETGYLDIRVFNSGTSTVKGLKATLSKVEGDVIVTKGTYDFGDISAKRYKTIRSGSRSYQDRTEAALSSQGRVGKGCFEIRLPNDASEGEYSVLLLEFEDSFGNKWNQELRFLQEKPLLGVDASIGYYDKPSYEFVYPGEDLYLRVEVKNTSNGMLSGLSGVFSTDSEYADLSDEPFVFGDLRSGYSDALRHRKDNPIKISAKAPVGETIFINFTMKDSTGLERTFTRDFVVGAERFDPTVVRVKISGIAPDGSMSVKSGGYAYLDAVLYNVGPVNGENVTATFSSDSPYVSINTEEISLGKIVTGRYKSIGYPQGSISGYQKLDDASSHLAEGYGAELKISDNTPSGERVPVKMTISESGVPLYEYQFSVTVI